MLSEMLERSEPDEHDGCGACAEAHARSYVWHQQAQFLTARFRRVRQQKTPQGRHIFADSRCCSRLLLPFPVVYLAVSLFLLVLLVLLVPLLNHMQVSRRAEVI